jgi:GNAT superfamily N-acetyltransferase
MLEYVENNLDVDTYLKLREEVKWTQLTRAQAQKGLENSLYILTAYEDGRAVGMGRIVGDGAIVCYVQDLIVVPDKQGDGIGGLILERLRQFVKQEGIPGTRMMLDLMCAKGREQFYTKHHFTARPTETLGPGMIQYLDL